MGYPGPMMHSLTALLWGVAFAHDPVPADPSPAPTPRSDAAAEDDTGGGAGDNDWDVLATFADHHEASFSLDEGTWMSVSVHGETLVFDLLGDIWSMPLAGGAATRLTDDAAWDSEPRLSPDGAHIAFARFVGDEDQGATPAQQEFLEIGD